MKLIILLILLSISAAIILGIPMVGYPEIFTGNDSSRKYARLALLILWSLSCVPISIIVESYFRRK